VSERKKRQADIARWQDAKETISAWLIVAGFVTYITYLSSIWSFDLGRELLDEM